MGADSNQRDREWERRVFAVLGCDTPQHCLRWEEAVEHLAPLERAARLSDFAQQTTYERWWPLLRKYADECCENRSPVDAASLSPADREKRRILRTMLEEQQRKLGTLQPRPHTAAIACIDEIAMADLLEVFSPSGDVACLTPEEQRRWNAEIYDGRLEQELGYWWCDQHYWTITETPTSEAMLSSLPADIRETPGYWIVSEGHASGSLCGSGADEVWTWDGRHAERTQGGSFWVS
jgi:hypothetical protein